MPKYFVRFECPLRVRLSTYAELQGENRVLKQFIGTAIAQPSFVLYDLIEKEGAVSLPHGIGFDAHIEAPNIAEAIRQCDHAANFVVDMITLATQAEPSAPKFVLAYDAPPGVTERELMAENPLGAAVVSRMLNGFLLMPIVIAANELRGKAATSCEAAERIERVDRAIKWLRKGIGETAILDEFTAYWVGLEVLDPILKPVQRVFRSCPNCDKPISKCDHCGTGVPQAEKTVNVLEGIRYVMEEKRGIEAKAFKNIRSMRGALLHGGKGLGKPELDTLTKYIPDFRRGLVNAIGLVLGLGDDVIAALAAADPRRMHAPVRQRLREFIHLDEIPALHEIDKQPRIEVDAVRTVNLRQDKDDVNETYSCDPHEINCSLIQENGRLVGILSDPFSGLRMDQP
jgi:hypothetical protein